MPRDSLARPSACQPASLPPTTTTPVRRPVHRQQCPWPIECPGAGSLQRCQRCLAPPRRLLCHAAWTGHHAVPPHPIVTCSPPQRAARILPPFSFRHPSRSLTAWEALSRLRLAASPHPLSHPFIPATMLSTSRPTSSARVAALIALWSASVTLAFDAPYCSNQNTGSGDACEHSPHTHAVCSC